MLIWWQLQLNMAWMVSVSRVSRFLTDCWHLAVCNAWQHFAQHLGSFADASLVDRVDGFAPAYLGQESCYTHQAGFAQFLLSYFTESAQIPCIATVADLASCDRQDACTLPSALVSYNTNPMSCDQRYVSCLFQPPPYDTWQKTQMLKGGG